MVMLPLFYLNFIKGLFVRWHSRNVYNFLCTKYMEGELILANRYLVFIISPFLLLLTLFLWYDLSDSRPQAKFCKG